MGDKSAIEWTDATWNPVRGCTHVSSGCDHCYAAALAYRYGGPGQPYEGLAEKRPDGVSRFTGEVRPVPAMLDRPLRWRAPRRIFVNSMSDLFHVDLVYGQREFLDQMFAIMALTPRHTYQALTKRPALAAKYLADPATPARIHWSMQRWHLFGRGSEGWDWGGVRWPLPNVWVGTSVEDDRERARIALLRRAPAAVHFLSCEPLIGPLDLGRGLLWDIEWVIAGGESGPRHRPVEAAWVRDIRDACLSARVPFLFKQWGGATPKAGGRTLDGRTWDEYPEVA